MKQFTQSIDRFFEKPLIDRAEQAATAHGIAGLRNGLSVQWSKVCFTKFPGRAKGIFRGSGLRIWKPRDLPIDEDRRPWLFHPHLYQTVCSSTRCARPGESNFIE